MNSGASDSTPGPLRERLRAAPRVSRAAVAADRMTDLRRGLAQEARLLTLLDRSPIHDLLACIADHAPFLWRLAVADPDRCAELFDTAPETALADGLDTLAAQLADQGLDLAAAGVALRRARQRVALLVALADLGGVWGLDEVTEALTRFADAAVGGALTVLLREAVRTGKFRPGTEAATCGLAVLALGKGGGGELNYSSDIDLVVLFDPAAPALAEGAAATPTFVRLTQALARLLQEPTGDGFVLRVDLRLRPDPASTPVAIALPSAFSYYETLGQNWERAAFIKARPVAGDLGLGEGFLRDLAPFIWRKYFDYAAIADIHAMKRQIHAVRGQGTVAVLGYDVKLGRGGIREIEFFVQTQQLIFGGRRPALRGRQTCATLVTLAAEGWIDAVARDELTAAYHFLRGIEHRLQMIGDQQTQRLPEAADELARFAAFSGFADVEAFSGAMLGHLRRVQHHYARLFEDAPGLDVATGSLVFTGTVHDPATLATLAQLGFARPADAAELVRGWHFGRRPAVRSPRAREVLTELVPALLEALARTADPDAALAAFDSMLGRMTAGIELLSLLRAHAGLRDLFADILGSAPRLAATVAQRPHVLDAAIDPAFFDRQDRTIGARMRAALDAITETEDWLDRMRDLAREETFHVGVRVFAGVDDVVHSQADLTEIADTAIRSALDRAVAELEAGHGRCPNGACVVLGMGRLGSREMTASSDLDLIVIYRAEGDSDGARSLGPARYYARLTQKLIAFLTVPTRRGGLYEVDLRLRPSGRQGPVAVRLTSFRSYQESEAHSWEHLALTRARVVGGDAALADEVRAVVGQVLRRPRDQATLWQEVRTMRELVEAEKGHAGAWDMKFAPGGLLDLEFAAQGLVLGHAADHPSLLQAHPAAILAEAGRLALIPPDAAASLSTAHRLQATLLHLMRFMSDGTSDPDRLGTGAVRRLCRAVDQPDVRHLEADLTEQRGTVLRRLAGLTQGGHA